jgi:hypothetical protein
MRIQGQTWLRGAYQSDWSHEAKARAEVVGREPIAEGENASDVTSNSWLSLDEEPTCKKLSIEDSREEGPMRPYMLFQSAEQDHNVPSLSEVDRYLSLPQARSMTPFGAETCILTSWAAHEGQLPHLSLMARQFLALPASCAGPERLFSAACRMHNDLKKSMMDETLQHTLII